MHCITPFDDKCINWDITYYIMHGVIEANAMAYIVNLIDINKMSYASFSAAYPGMQLVSGMAKCVKHTTLHSSVDLHFKQIQSHIERLNAHLHIRLVREDILGHSLRCHPPQWHLVLEGGHVLGCVSGETKVWYLEQLPLIHQDVAAGQVTVEDTQGREVLLIK